MRAAPPMAGCSASQANLALSSLGVGRSVTVDTAVLHETLRHTESSSESTREEESAKSVQSGASYLSQGFEDNVLESSSG